MKTEFRKAISLLEQLHKDYPSYSLGRHISSAISDYGDPWGMTDKEFFHALVKYKAILEMAGDEMVTDEYIRQITEDANNLFKKEEDEEDGD